MEPTYVGRDTISCGQLETANELALDDAADVGFSLNPITAVDNLSKGVSRTLKKLPVSSAAMSAAESVLRSGPMQTLHKIMRNPIVTTAFGPASLPSIANLSLAASKGGAKGAIKAAKAELKNPVRRAAVKAAALVFPPIAPAAAGLEAANRVLDASESGSASEKAKAIAQIAATYALAEEGDAGAKKGLAFLSQAKKIRPPKTAASKLGNPRLAVCGARDEESKGVWLKIHFHREGAMLHATVYGVGGGEVEITRLSVNLAPVIAYVKRLHDKLHEVSGSSVGASSFANTVKVATKLGRAKLSAKAKETSRTIADKARCRAMTPGVPVSNTALALFAASKKGVEAVQNAKKLDGALRGTAAAIKRYASVKNVLAKMPLPQKQAAMQNPSVRQTVIDGVGAKIAAAKFIRGGGPEKAAALRKTAAAAQSKFQKLAADSKSADPEKRLAAQKTARVVSIAAKSREKVKSAASNSLGGLAGIVVGPRGKLVRGRFNRRTPAPGESAQVILTKLGLERGIFTKVGHQKSALADRYRRRLAAIRRLARVGCFGAAPPKKAVGPGTRAAVAQKIRSMSASQKAKLAAAVRALVKKKAESKKGRYDAALRRKRLIAARKRRVVNASNVPLSPGPSPYTSAPGGGGGGPSPYVNDPSADNAPSELSDDGREAPGYAEAYEEHDSLEESDYVEDDSVDLGEGDGEMEEAIEGLIACAGGF